MRAAARQEAVGRGVVPARGYLRLASVTASICAALLAGPGSAGLANKPKASAALPKTPNACSRFGAPRIVCRWDVKIVVAANYVSRGYGPSGPSSAGVDMHASWSVTYKKLIMAIRNAADLALSENEPEGDIIKIQGGGPYVKAVTSAKVTYDQVGSAPCSWEKSYSVPTTLGVISYLKLLKPIRGGLPWSFVVHSYYDKEIGGTGNYCEPGNTEAVGLGMPEQLCCRIGGPPTTSIALAQSSGQPFFYTKLERDYWTKLGKLPFPWTNVWAGRSFNIQKRWRTARNDDGTSSVQSGSVTVSFVRRR